MSSRGGGEHKGDDPMDGAQPGAAASNHADALANLYSSEKAFPQPSTLDVAAAYGVVSNGAGQFKFVKRSPGSSAGMHARS